MAIAILTLMAVFISFLSGSKYYGHAIFFKCKKHRKMSKKSFFVFYFMASKVNKKVINFVLNDNSDTALFVPSIAAIRCSLKSWRGMKFSLLLLLFWLLVTMLMFVLLKILLFKVVKLATALSPLHKGWSHMQTVALIMFTKWLEQSGFTAGALLHDRLVTENRTKIIIFQPSDGFCSTVRMPIVSEFHIIQSIISNNKLRVWWYVGKQMKFGTKNLRPNYHFLKILNQHSFLSTLWIISIFEVCLFCFSISFNKMT